MKKPIVVSVLNHKGGVLKTSLTVNLGAALAIEGKKVLLIDVDQQGSLTGNFLGYVTSEGEPSLVDAFLDEGALDHLITPTTTPNLDLIPCTEEFMSVDVNLAGKFARERVLANCLSKTKAFSSYDYVLIDNPPSFSLVVVNSLIASDYYLIPCEAEFMSQRSLRTLGKAIQQVVGLVPELQLLGIVLTKFSPTERITKQTEAMLRKDMGHWIFDTRVRVNTKAKWAYGSKQTVFQYEKAANGRGTEDFTALAAEFLRRVEEFEVEKGAEENVAEAANG